jgi:hypothetical protein
LALARPDIYPFRRPPERARPDVAEWQLLTGVSGPWGAETLDPFCSGSAALFDL